MGDYFQFRWVLNDPFLLNKREEASFFVEYPAVTRWLVEVLPLRRVFNTREYVCALRFDNRFEPSQVTAEILEMSVLRKTELVMQRNLFNYTFSEETNYKFSFSVETEDYFEWRPRSLRIDIYIKVRREGCDAARITRNNEEMPIMWGGNPRDMNLLVKELQYCLESKSHTTISVNQYDAHHFILQKRWTNLFKFHGLDENSDSVRIDISDKTLRCILNYMYTGDINTKWSLWTNMPVVVELFNVIFHYHIFHFYNSLVNPGSCLMLDSANYALVIERSIELRFIALAQLTPHSVTFPMNPPFPISDPDEGPREGFEFSVHLQSMGRCGLWLHYFLVSRSQTVLNVQVNLRMSVEDVKRFVHFGDYNIPANGRVQSGPILFMGCRYTFGTFESIFREVQLEHPSRDYRNLYFNIICSNGSSVVQYTRDAITEGDIWLPTSDLSLHMSDILRQQFRSDLVVQSRGDLGDETMVVHRLHKAIFDTRFPGWRSVIRPPIPADMPLPDVVTLPISNESFKLVASYMYTGKLMEVPPALHREILRFAVHSRFNALKELIASHYTD